jgi:ABC-type branched-subunit amino acid transport system substrate-binding protein
MKIQFEDNNSTAQGSVSAINKLITIHKLPVIFGPAASSNFLAVCPIAQKSRVVLIGAESAAAAISKCGSYVFRVFPFDALQGKGVAGLALDLGYKEIVLTYINIDWGLTWLRYSRGHTRPQVEGWWTNSPMTRARPTAAARSSA